MTPSLGGDCPNFPPILGGLEHPPRTPSLTHTSPSPLPLLFCSWGTDWGEAGFIYLAYGENTCDITNDPTWVSVGTVAKKN